MAQKHISKMALPQKISKSLMFKGTDWPSKAKSCTTFMWSWSHFHCKCQGKANHFVEESRLSPNKWTSTKKQLSHFHAISFFVQMNDTFKASRALCFHWQFPFCQATTSRSKTRIPRCSQSTRLRFARLPHTSSHGGRGLGDLGKFRNICLPRPSKNVKFQPSGLGGKAASISDPWRIQVPTFDRSLC